MASPQTIHTNVSNFEMASPQTIQMLKKLLIFICYPCKIRLHSCHFDKTELKIMIFINFQVCHRNEKNFESSYGLGARHLKNHMTRGGYSSEVLVGVCRPVPQILTQFQTKIFHFPHPFSDLTSKIHTHFQTFVVIKLRINNELKN